MGMLAVTEVQRLIGIFHYNEDFESGLGNWTQSTSDDFDWTRQSRATSSTATGPNSAFAGSFYIYTEASFSNNPSKTAILNGPCFNLNTCGTPIVNFRYHMYGIDMGILYLEVETTPSSGAWTTIWSMAGDQGDIWKFVSVGLGAYAGTTIKLRFRGLTGSGFESDMAIDDVNINC